MDCSQLQDASIKPLCRVCSQKLKLFWPCGAFFGFSEYTHLIGTTTDFSEWVYSLSPKNGSQGRTHSMKSVVVSVKWVYSSTDCFYDFVFSYIFIFLLKCFSNGPPSMLWLNSCYILESIRLRYLNLKIKILINNLYSIYTLARGRGTGIVDKEEKFICKFSRSQQHTTPMAS